MTDEGFVSFDKRRIKGSLFQVQKEDKALLTQVDAYSKSGAQLDLRFVRLLYGLINFSDRREFSYFWESPFAELEGDNYKRKRVAQQQRQTNLSRVIATATDLNTAKEFVKLAQDFEKEDNTATAEGADVVHTVSRVVQAFEKRSVRNVLSLIQSNRAAQRFAHGYGQTLYSQAAEHMERLMTACVDPRDGEIEPIVNTLRRSGHTYDLFAQLVAAELNLLEGTNGTRITSQHLSRRLQRVRDDAQLALLAQLDSMEHLPADTYGMPYMHVQKHLIVRHGILVLSPANEDEAGWVLQLRDAPPNLDWAQYDGVDIVSVTFSSSTTTSSTTPSFTTSNPSFTPSNPSLNTLNPSFTPSNPSLTTSNPSFTTSTTVNDAVL